MPPLRLQPLTRPLAGLALLLATACAARPPAPPAAGDTVADELGAWMSGVFSSREQAADDQDYRPIRHAGTPIWSDRTDGPWLYVEQAEENVLTVPFRQCVYHLVEQQGAVRTEVFSLPGNPLTFAGAWRNPSRFDLLRPEDLRPQRGCAVNLKREGSDRFVGSYRGAACECPVPDAEYATTEISVSPSRMERWDRGYDSDGNQVWGAAKGPYVFERMPTTEVVTVAAAID